MNKIYVVATGYYSDFSLEGVFDSKELAQAFGGKFPEYAEVRIFEYVVNNPNAQLERYQTKINLKTGEIVESIIFTQINELNDFSYMEHDGKFIVYQSHISQAHANECALMLVQNTGKKTERLLY